MKARTPAERGAALLTVMVSIAVLTAMAVDLAYQSRVSLRIAANARDELRASYLARSGVTLSRLVLSFQSPTGGGGGAPGQLQVPRVNIWRLVPVGSALVESLFPGSAPPAEAGQAAAPQAAFEAVIEDESLKVSAQLEASSADVLRAQVQALYQLVCDPRWDPLFDREDERGVRTTREELLVYLRDWVDGKDQTSGLVPDASSGSAPCAMVPAPRPFEEAFGDENHPYDRGDDRYRTKNERMDSLDELYLVAGVGDAFMAAFGDALTVYVERDGKQNVNQLDRKGLLQLAASVANPPLLRQPVALDPRFPDQLEALMMEQTFGGIFSITPVEVGQLLQRAGLSINMTPLQPGPNSPYTDSSTTFRIRARGAAGDVTKEIDAVVRLTQPQPGQPVAAPGKIIHWREE